MTLTERIENINKHLEQETNAQRREKLRALREELIELRINTEETTSEAKQDKLAELWNLALIVERKGHLDVAKRLRDVYKRMGA